MPQIGEMLRDLAPAAVAAFGGIAAAGNDQHAQTVGLRRAIDEEARRLDLADGADMKAIGLHRVGDLQGQLDAFAARRRAGPQGTNSWNRPAESRSHVAAPMPRADSNAPRQASAQ